MRLLITQMLILQEVLILDIPHESSLLLESGGAILWKAPINLTKKSVAFQLSVVACFNPYLTLRLRIKFSA